VSVVDPDRAKARRMMESLDVQAVVGDGTRADVLMQAGASKADLVVAVADDDHVNMLACVLSKDLGAERVIMLPDQYLAAWVRQHTDVEVISWAGSCIVHERFTPAEAEANLNAAAISARDMRERVDREAARILLQTELDRMAAERAS